MSAPSMWANPVLLSTIPSSSMPLRPSTPEIRTKSLVNPIKTPDYPGTDIFKPDPRTTPTSGANRRLIGADRSGAKEECRRSQRRSKRNRRRL